MTDHDEVLRCDICYSTAVEWAFPVRDFILSVDTGPGGILAETAGSWWGACTPCADLIDAGDKDGLLLRAQTQDPIWQELSPWDRVRGAARVRAAHARFLANRCGPREHLAERDRLRAAKEAAAFRAHARAVEDQIWPNTERERKADGDPNG